MSESEKNIRELIERRDQGVQNKDAKACLEALASDVVMFDLPPPLRYQGEEARNQEGLQQWLDSWEGPIETSAQDLQVHVVEDLALVYGLARMAGKKKDGEAVDLWYRTTIGLRKREDAWQVVHEHNSVPFAMDGSFRALTDLKP